MSSSQGDSGYQAVRVTLRPPRVALIFDGGDGWQSWAAMALHLAALNWGGVGFVFVPHRMGMVSGSMRRMVKQYDPDYVVLAGRTVSEYEAVLPNRIVMRDPAGEALTGQARAEQIAMIGETHIDDPYGEEARRTVIRDCSTYRQRWVQDGEESWHEQIDILRYDATSGPLTNVGGTEEEGTQEVCEGWGLARAARTGLACRPQIPCSSDEDGLADHSKRAAMAEALDAGASVLDSGGWAKSATGVVRIGPVTAHRNPLLMVVGATADDFALASAWDRLYGQGIWVPVDDAEHVDLTSSEIRNFGADLALNAQYKDREVVVTSASLSQEQIEAIRIRVVRHFSTDEVSYGEARTAGNLRWLQPSFLAIKDDYDLPLALPAVFDEVGNVDFAVPLPPQIPTNQEVLALKNCTWHIDVDLLGNAVPRGHMFAPEVLLTKTMSLFDSWVRSGRDGVSCWSGSWGFVAAGATRVQSLARPQLRMPGMLDWVRAVSEVNGVSVHHSHPGLRVEILRRLWGSRSALAEGWAGPLRPVFLGFLPKGKRSTESYTEGQGVNLRGEGYLTFDGVTSLFGARTPDDLDQLRRAWDDLVVRGIVQRGLILDCSDCGSPAFVRIGVLSNANECSRCGATSPLTLDRWRKPISEPVWYYDLHRAARELLRDDQGIALLGASELAKGARSYVDLSEVEFSRGSNRKVFAEVDLICCRDGKVIIGEAKSSLNLGGAEARASKANKLAQIARLMSAHEVALLTDVTGEWSVDDIKRLRMELSDCFERSYYVPAIRIVTGLATTQPVNELLET